MLSKGFLQTIDRIRSNDPELTSLLFLKQDFNEENSTEAFRILAEALEGNIWATNFMVNAKKDDANYQKSCEYLTRNQEILKATLDCAKSTFGAKIFVAICAKSPDVKAKIIEADLDRELLSFAKNNFLLRLSPAEIISFSQNWHKTLTQGLINSLKDYNGTSWPTLFQQKEFSIPSEIIGKENWKIVELTSPAELKREGEMTRCFK